MFAEALARGAVQDVEENKQQQLYNKLKKFILNKLNEGKQKHQYFEYEYEHYKYVGLGSDYGPSKDLLDILKECDIPDKNVPWKTVMWISRNYLAVKGGYSSGIEVLYATPDYYNYEINSLKEVIDDYKSHKRDDYYTEEYITERIKDCEEEIKFLKERLEEV